jgi:crotonobetainyl-CoA:carnitine CoA-transferase CaiB-like acyl-CoA transferase
MIGPKVVDFSTHLSGPMASHLLAEAGADVIKIEPRKYGDGNRGLQPRAENGLGIFHLALNGGTRSLAASTRSESWPRLVEAAVQWADVVVVGSRPSDAAKRGLDFATLRAIKNDIVYCQISGFGERGPWQNRTAHGQTIDAFAGAVPITWENGRPETPAGWRTSGTVIGGVFAALGIFAGLYRRDHGQRTAQHVSISLWASALWWHWRDTTSLANLGETWNDYADLGPRYRMYETADHRAVLICPIEQKFWERFCDVAGLPAETRARGSWETSGMDFGGGEGAEAESEVVAARVREETLEWWTEALTASEVPFAPILTLAEVLGSEHAQQEEAMRSFTVRDTEVTVPASPVRVRESVEPPESELLDLAAPPELGADAESILADLGLSDLADW